MLLWLFEQLADYNSSFQVVRYLTLRSLLSLLTALTIGLVLGPVMIRKLQALKYGWRSHFFGMVFRCKRAHCLTIF